MRSKEPACTSRSAVDSGSSFRTVRTNFAAHRCTELMNYEGRQAIQLVGVIDTHHNSATG